MSPTEYGVAVRHKIPEIVEKYNDLIKNGPPRCCHTCYEYTQDGVCEVFSSEPPKEFAETPGACDQWLFEIPF